MLAGFILWKSDVAKQYIAAGYWENRTIVDMIYAVAERFPGKVALIDGDRQVSYAELREYVERLAYGLLRAGIKNNDRVVMQLPNSVEFVFTYLALTRIGAIPVMALRSHRQSEIRHFALSSGAVAYVIPDTSHRFDYRPMAEALREECPALKSVFVLGDPLPGQLPLRPLIDAEVSLTDVSTSLAGVHPDPADVATMLLSGGTTSLSKLIPRTHNDYGVAYGRLRKAEEAGGTADSVLSEHRIEDHQEVEIGVLSIHILNMAYCRF